METSSRKSKNISLQEYGEVDCHLFPEEVAILRREYSNAVDLTPTTDKDNFILKAKQYVGFVVLPTGKRINIRPKVSIGVLFEMLSRTNALAEFTTEEARHATVEDLFEFLVEHFIGSVEDLAARGILRNFEREEEALLTIRGKILLPQTIRDHPGVHERHHCSFSEHTADIDENRILKLACLSLLPYRFEKPQLKSRVRRLLRMFAGVENILDHNRAYNRLVFHRLNEHYRPAIMLAKMILSHLSPSGSPGPQQYRAYLVDMVALFEKYIEKVLTDAAARTPLSIRPQDKNYHLDLHNSINVRPDVVVYRGANQVLAVDAKYKSDNLNQDVYQALSYCHALDIPHSILVYPKIDHVEALRHHIRPSGQIAVSLSPIDLSGNVVAMRQHAQDFAESIWKEVEHFRLAREGP